MAKRIDIEQVNDALTLLEQGSDINDVATRYGVSVAAVRRWKSVYGTSKPSVDVVAKENSPSVKGEFKLVKSPDNKKVELFANGSKCAVLMKVNGVPQITWAVYGPQYIDSATNLIAGLNALITEEVD